MGTTLKPTLSGLSEITSPFPEEAARKQVDRIVGSESLRHSETLQRLLGYLADKSLCGEADQLKEYAIGVDLFGKGSEYDPRHDSSARIHVGRLRQKLVEYYASEGIQDSVIVTLPKGRFKLLFVPRPVPWIPPTAEQADEGNTVTANPSHSRWRAVASGLAAALLLVIAWGIWSGNALRRPPRNETVDASWTPAMQEFWGPFADNGRPLVIAVGTPLFVGFRGLGVYREMNMNRWDDVATDSNLLAVKKALGNPETFPNYTYTGFGETKSALLLGTLLARHAHDIQFVRSIDLSWEQLVDSNVIFLGDNKTFGDALHAFPVRQEINLEPTGVRIVSPADGAPGFFGDGMIAANGSGLSSVSDDGVTNAVIGILPNPNGKGFVGTFLSNVNIGTLAAVEYATDPNLLRQLTDKLKDGSGRVPRYFQIAIEVTSRGGVPVSSRYVMHREVHLDSNALSK
jgi:hypothetical protein